MSFFRLGKTQELREKKRAVDFAEIFRCKNQARNSGAKIACLVLSPRMF
jgi:hypothetical protein